MCKWGTHSKVELCEIDLKGLNKEQNRKRAKMLGLTENGELIDLCIAPLVQALQKGGIDMNTSCCGHGGNLGDIHLQDGRILLIANRPYSYSNSRTRYFLKVAFENWKYSTKIRLRVRRNNFLWKLKKLFHKE